MLQPDLRDSALPSRAWLDHHHFIVAAATMLLGAACLLRLLSMRRSLTTRGTVCLHHTVLLWVGAVAWALAILCGVAMELHLESLVAPARISYTLLDVSLVVLLAMSIVVFAEGLGRKQLPDQTETWKGRLTA